MHEVSIMQDALERAFEVLEREGATRILMLRLRIGALSGVVPEALEFAFEAITPGTPAEGGRLEIERVAVSCACRGCGASFEPPDIIFVCPQCQEISSDVRAGMELEIASMEVERP
jgi:hydrogenase nickel incorporation protein HypA/HybF